MDMSDDVRVTEARNGPTYLAYSVSTALLIKLDIINFDLNPVLAEKGIVASEKSHSYSSFAFSYFRTPVTRMSFFHCCHKHGNIQVLG